MCFFAFVDLKSTVSRCSDIFCGLRMVRIRVVFGFLDWGHVLGLGIGLRNMFRCSPNAVCVCRCSPALNDVGNISENTRLGPRTVADLA